MLYKIEAKKPNGKPVSAKGDFRNVVWCACHWEAKGYKEIKTYKWDKQTKKWTEQ